MSGLWNGALTGSFIILRQPRALRISMAASTASAWPAMTIWPGPLKLAGTTTRPVWVWAVRQAASTSAALTPRMAAMAPTPTGTATCMARPRSRTVATAAPKVRAPAATRALYSPREWPATKSGLGRRAPKARTTMVLWVRMAGWVCSVSFSWSSGPWAISAERGNPRTSSASWSTAWAAGSAAARSTPMPTAWEP